MSSTLISTRFYPQWYARIAGALYLFIIIAGGSAEFFIRGKLIVAGDALATANNIISSSLLWRIGILADLLMQVCDLPVMLVFYLFFRSVNKHLALLNLLFNLIQTAVLVANKLNLVIVMSLLGNGEYLKTIGPDQLHSLAYVYLNLHDYGFAIGLIFFGFVCLMEGYLIYKSTFLPKFIGILMGIAGICYLTNSFAGILAPKLASALFPTILMPCLIAELTLSLWLIVKGVNVEKVE